MNRKLTLNAQNNFDPKLNKNEIVFKLQPERIVESSKKPNPISLSESFFGEEFVPPEGMNWDLYGNPYIIED